MASIRAKKNNPQKNAGDREGQCYYCKRLTPYEFEETSGFQIVDKHICDVCLKELLKSINDNMPEIIERSLEDIIIRKSEEEKRKFFNMYRRFDAVSTELKELVNKNDETIKALEEDILKCKEEISHLEIMLSHKTEKEESKSSSKPNKTKEEVAE